MTFHCATRQNSKWIGAGGNAYVLILTQQCGSAKAGFTLKSFLAEQDRDDAVDVLATLPRHIKAAASAVQQFTSARGMAHIGHGLYYCAACPSNDISPCHLSTHWVRYVRVRHKTTGIPQYHGAVLSISLCCAPRRLPALQTPRANITSLRASASTRRATAARTGW